MTTLQPRPPYSDDEIARLYPSNLQLQQVQILLRHGERTPVNGRFQNAGLHEYWPYCQAANQIKSVMLAADGSWDQLTWKRRFETLGKQDRPTLSAGPQGEIDAICQPGELTDRGRETTLALGQRTRTLYVNQLGFLPAFLDETSASDVRLRATPIQRALESVQQAFIGLYPAATRSPGLPPPTVTRRLMQDETLFPNESGCKRFRELSVAFAERTASLWNDSPEMNYINKKLGKWMPKDSPKVGVNSHPRLSGIMDSINASLAHGPATRLPGEFYDKQVVEHVGRICTEEWFVGYQESNEYRRLGIGSLIGDITQRMVEHTHGIPAQGFKSPFKLSMSGCHDTTIAATLTALGGFRVDRDTWPNFTASIAFELFKAKDSTTALPSSPATQQKSWWSSLFSISSSSSSASSAATTRRPLEELSDSDRSYLENHYVRIRYNDSPVTLPHCRLPGNHLPGDESFCTLTAFKQATDQLTPADWRAECKSNLGSSAFPAEVQPPPGVVDETK